ncbi:ABC transporter substrate-binding protein [Occultella aeris]|uniref:sn-glycerol-3-phosphate-binding periplasmic protein UgpB n=1 Tax=Occultella aeris TaxID=2761496 RepID=A0A7M4DDQ8_9MICO|nr:extracellular solute-binding protein [Occultella aeris]VZO34978.1 sn-glycerol-3-phosphate-binding periplasmic protein UgpB precursor [Occultella aeris]
MTYLRPAQISRRGLLTGGLGAAAGLGLAACGSSDSPSGGGSSSGSPVELTIALIPDPPGASEFYRAQFDAFEAANPGITIKVVENPSDQQLSAIELMFQQGNAPDIYRAQAAGFDRMYSRGWARSLEEFVTDDFLSRFPEGSLDPLSSGLHREGELYSIPLVWGKWSAMDLFVYNRSLLSASGFDAAPTTWGEIEEVARAVTTDGGGRVFGMAPEQASGIVRLSRQGVPYSIPGDGINLITGEPDTSNSTMVEAVELMRRMNADGSLITGWESWDGSRSYTEFAAGSFAMYTAQSWHLAEIRKLNPEIDLGIVGAPVPDSGRGSYTPITQHFDPLWSMSAETAHPEESWLVLDFLASEEFYRAYYEQFGTLTAMQTVWEADVQEDPDLSAMFDVAETTMKVVPNPKLASVGGAAILNARAERPELRFTDSALESMVKNEDFAPKAAALDEQLRTFLGEIYASGDASVEDIRFADWDPLQPYDAAS